MQSSENNRIALLTGRRAQTVLGPSSGTHVLLTMSKTAFLDGIKLVLKPSQVD